MSSILDHPDVRDSALRLDIDRYHQLFHTGIIPENTELLDGYVIQKLGKTPLHTWTVEFLADWLRSRISPDRHVRVEQPLTFMAADSEPEPDLAVVAGGRDDYRESHPATAELVIEVALSTAGMDRQKARLYADAGIAEYWLVLPAERQVVVHRQPQSGSYATVNTVNAGRITVVADSGIVLELKELFPELT